MNKILTALLGTVFTTLALAQAAAPAPAVPATPAVPAAPAVTAAPAPAAAPAAQEATSKKAAKKASKKAKKGKKGKVPPAFLKNKKGKKPTTNAVDDDDEEDEDEEPQVNARKKPVTTKEWLKNAPPEVRNVVQNAMGVELKQRRKLIGDLVANIEDDEERQKEAKFYERMPTDTLVRLHNNHVSDSGEPTANASFVYPFGGIPHPALMQSYEGAAGVFGNNSSRASSDEDSEEDMLQPITMNMFDAKGNLKTDEKPAKKRA